MKNFKKNFITTFVIGAVLLAGIVIVVNMIFNTFNIGRFDLTANRIYKLSPSVGKILFQLEAPIDMTYYVSSSEKMPTQWKNLERDVIDKLEDLRVASKGKLSYSIFDPSAEEEKEAYEEIKDKEQAKEEAAKDVLKQDKDKPKVTRKKIAEQLYERGVIPFGVQSAERDELSVKRIYSSIVLSYLDRKEDVIEEVRPETFGNLEYEIISRIYKLISNKRPKIGFYPGQPEIPPQYRQYYQQQPPDQYSYAENLLKESGYDVTRTNIKKDEPIPEGIQTLVLMIDQPLNERQLYEIDKLIHNGVRIVMTAQQYNYQIMPSQGQPGQFDLRGMPSRLNINTLVKNYGFEFDEKMFMDRSAAFIQIPVYQTRRMGMFQVREQRYEPVAKPVIIKVNAENINSDLSISNKITELFYMYGNRVLVHEEIMKENKLDFKVLFTSSNFSWTREGIGYGNIDVSEPSSEDVLKRQPLGILVEGKFKPQYVDQNIPKWTDETGAKADSSEPELPSEIVGDPKEDKIIAIGCSNMFKNDILQSVVSHKALLLNAVDALTLGDELINIRSKNIIARRIQATSGVGKALSKAFVVWFPPLVFVALGIIVTIKRKKKQ